MLFELIIDVITGQGTVKEFFMMGIDAVKFCFSRNHRAKKILEWKNTPKFEIIIETIVSLFSLLVTTAIISLLIFIIFSIVF